MAAVAMTHLQGRRASLQGQGVGRCYLHSQSGSVHHATLRRGWGGEGPKTQRESQVSERQGLLFRIHMSPYLTPALKILQGPPCLWGNVHVPCSGKGPLPTDPQAFSACLPHPPKAPSLCRGMVNHCQTGR